jgi:hypothetical protein
MTRTAKTLISMLTVIAVSVGLASSAMAYYSTGSANASRDDQQSATPQSAPGSPNAIVGNEGGQPSGNVAANPPADSVNATIVGNEGGQPSGNVAANPPADSVNATIVGNEGGLPSGNLATDPRLFSAASGDLRAVSSSDGFDWGAALVGAGAALGLALATALGLGMARRRTRLEPSV